MTREETYLGDGLYASFDGWYIWLKTERDDGEHSIALEGAVLGSLLQYARKLGWKEP